MELQEMQCSLVAALTERQRRTGLVYDDGMVLHRQPSGPHLERPERIKCIFDELLRRGIVEECLRIPVREATREELLTVHSRAYCDKMVRLEKRCTDVILAPAASAPPATAVAVAVSVSAIDPPPSIINDADSSSSSAAPSSDSQSPSVGENGLIRLTSQSSFSSTSSATTGETVSPRVQDSSRKTHQQSKKKKHRRRSRGNSKDAAMVGVVKQVSLSDREVNEIAQQEFDSVFLNRFSFRCARLAAGGAIGSVDAVVSGECNNALVIIRPPGHHAESHCAMGFCIYNNVALAAKQAIKKHGLERVLIVDWDVHHGNGTQRTFYSDSRVLYFSVHRWNSGDFYPHGEGGSPSKIGGNGADAGKNVNVALNGVGFKDEDYFEIWNRVLIPIMKEFSPELIIVSAGFDAAVNDPIGGFCITPKGYRSLLSELLAFANGRVILILEGGYNLESISNSMAECAEELLAWNSGHLSHPKKDTNTKQREAGIQTATIQAIKATIKEQARYWTAFA